MVVADFRMWYIQVESGGSRMEWRRQPGVKWRQPDGIPSRVECAGSHTPCILDLLKDSKELSSISDCFGDQKAIKTPKLNTIWLELIAMVLNMLIGLKGDNYYSKVFKRVNYKLWNSTFWVVINMQMTKNKMFLMFLQAETLFSLKAIVEIAIGFYFFDWVISIFMGWSC